VSASVRYLLAAENADGGWGAAPGQRSTQLHTGWAAMGLAAAGHAPPRAVAYMRAHARELTDIGSVERTILALRAAGASARDVGGRDLVAALLRGRRADGSFAGRVNTTAFAVLALRAAGRPARDRTVGAAARWIAAQAAADGGFNFQGGGGPSDIDDTGAAIQALVAAGRRGSMTVKRAAIWLVRHQNADGGFPLQPGAGSNAQSTAWAVQGLLAAGRDTAKLRRGTRDPLGYLRSLTAPSGEVRYSASSRQTPVWVTGQALMALERKALPIARVARVKRRKPHHAASAPAAPAAKPTSAPTATPTSTPTAKPAKRSPRPKAHPRRTRHR
jgi:energy-coupling factor transport system substrate-specific component